MRLPLLVVCKLSAHNLLATHAMAVSVPDRSELGAAADPADVPDLIACLLAAQQRRVDKFREFRRGFDALMASGDMVAYNAVCARVAAAFRDVSTEVNALGASLRAAGREDLGDAVRTLQLHEKEQLRLEATLQVLRKEHAAGKWSWQLGDGAAGERGLAGVAPQDVRPSWATNCRAHVPGGAPGGGAVGDGATAVDQAGASAPLAGCQCGVAEPTEAEYNAAVAEATQALQAAVTGINEALDELREAAHDARE